MSSSPNHELHLYAHHNVRRQAERISLCIVAFSSYWKNIMLSVSKIMILGFTLQLFTTKWDSLIRIAQKELPKTCLMELTGSIHYSSSNGLPTADLCSTQFVIARNWTPWLDLPKLIPLWNRLVIATMFYQQVKFQILLDYRRQKCETYEFSCLPRSESIWVFAKLDLKMEFKHRISIFHRLVFYRRWMINDNSLKM